MTDQTADWRMAVFRTAMPFTDKMQDVIRKDMTARAAKMRMHSYRSSTGPGEEAISRMTENRKRAGEIRRRALWPRIKPLRAMGMSSAAVARELGVSSHTILRIEKAFGHE